jgi:hypothetical protein
VADESVERIGGLHAVHLGGRDVRSGKAATCRDRRRSALAASHRNGNVSYGFGLLLASASHDMACTISVPGIREALLNYEDRGIVKSGDTPGRHTVYRCPAETKVPARRST